MWSDGADSLNALGLPLCITTLVAWWIVRCYSYKHLAHPIRNASVTTYGCMSRLYKQYNNPEVYIYNYIINIMCNNLAYLVTQV